MAEKPQLKAKPNRPSKINQHSGQKGSGNKGSGGGGKPPRNKDRSQNSGGNSNQPPSPWLDPDNEPNPDRSASFVEYLRWMRPADHEYKDATKTQILQMAMEGANYDQRLKTLNQRTKLIAKETIEVTCPWRIRVGGHRGPESILLPAFDAQGTPFIPSSTLRGVARNQAVREILDKNPDWQTLMAGDRQNKTIKKKIQKLWENAHKQLAPYFGALDVEKENQAGKIVFLDAYPIAGKFNLEMDMANNIWKWPESGIPKYDKPNPNAFLSLKETSFLIGLRLITGENNQQLLKQVKDWLLAGLANGAGSQINTGYGQLISKDSPKPEREFLRVKFALEGQLIHGYQKFSNLRDPYKKDRDGNYKLSKDGKLQGDGKAQAEVRPTAFKSMLRYWFRVFALGVISTDDVQTWEGKIFGAITPTQEHGYLRVNISDSQVNRREAKGKNDPSGEMEGTLTFAFSSEVPSSLSPKISGLVKNLTWLMFNLGGFGQGARRPCYSRKSRQYAPWWRGSTFYLETDPWNDSEDLSAKEFAKLFRTRLRGFYRALDELSSSQINPERLQNCGGVNQFSWQEAADQHCRILIAQGEEDFAKPFALAQLHHQKFKVNGDYDGNLCGQVRGKGGVKPSPVWIADVGENYQVVTIFGATASPRRDYVRTLRDAGAIQVFPFQ